MKFAILPLLYRISMLIIIIVVVVIVGIRPAHIANGGIGGRQCLDNGRFAFIRKTRYYSSFLSAAVSSS